MKSADCMNSMVQVASTAPGLTYQQQILNNTMSSQNTAQNQQLFFRKRASSNNNTQVQITSPT